MPYLQREWGDVVKSARKNEERGAESFLLHQTEILNEEHNDLSAADNYKTKIKLEERKKKQESEKAYMATIHNTVSKNLIGNYIANASHSVKLAQQRVIGYQDQNSMKK